MTIKQIHYFIAVAETKSFTNAARNYFIAQTAMSQQMSALEKELAKHNDISSEMKVYLDAGEKDEGRFYEGGSILHNMLKKKGVNTQNYLFPGHHNTEYVQSNVSKYLEFYGSI